MEFSEKNWERRYFSQSKEDGKEYWREQRRRNREREKKEKQRRDFEKRFRRHGYDDFEDYADYDNE